MRSRCAYIGDMKTNLKNMTQTEKDAYYTRRMEKAIARRAGKTDEQLRAEYTAQQMQSRVNEAVRVEKAEVGIWNDPMQYERQ